MKLTINKIQRQIIHIDQEKCIGCQLCVNACHEGAIGIVNGKATLLRDDYCDGLGDCLPTCPTNAISFITKETLPYDEKAVQANKQKNNSELQQWPVQLKLLPTVAPYYHHCDLLLAADCSAYAYQHFHKEFMKGKITMIACPKLDGVDYTKKLSEIIKNNQINSITTIKMEVPCCRGLEKAITAALQQSNKDIPLTIKTMKTNGTIIQ